MCNYFKYGTDDKPRLEIFFIQPAQVFKVILLEGWRFDTDKGMPLIHLQFTNEGGFHNK